MEKYVLYKILYKKGSSIFESMDILSQSIFLLMK